MKTISQRSPRHTQSGVMLLEALIGILIFSLGILAMVGLQSMSIRLAADSRERADASVLASQLIGEMWLNRAALASYQYSGTGTAPAALTTWIAQVNVSLPNAAATPPVITVGPSAIAAFATAGMQTTVQLRWQHPGDTTVHRYVMTAYIN